LQARLVALDLRDVAFMDCSGVYVIVDATLHAWRTGRRLFLLRGSPNIDRVFALTGSTDELELADVDPREPLVQALRQLAEADRAS
jgi:anti-anti-sigma factor